VVHYLPGVAVPEASGLRRRRLVVDHLHVVVPGGHRLARRDEIRIGELEDEPLILPAGSPIADDLLERLRGAARDYAVVQHG
jgi:DNA-binding transcriptional LysR family regulator